MEFLRLYRDALQPAVKRFWSLDRTSSISTLHRMLYDELRASDFRAHHVKQIYVYARVIVKAVKNNGGKKSVLRRLTARVDRYDYKLDLDNRVLVLKIRNNKEVKLRLLVSEERIEKFRGWRNYELAVRIADDNVYVSAYFRKPLSLEA